MQAVRVYRRWQAASLRLATAIRALTQVTARTMTSPPVGGRPPVVEAETLRKLVSELYPFKQVIAVKQLPSYDDRNYYVLAAMERREEEEFVLKLFNSVLFDRGTVEGQNSLLAHLNRKGLTGVAYPVPSRAGREVEEVSVERLTPEKKGEEVDREQAFLLRLVKYIPGEMFDEIDKVHITPHLLYDVGKYAGRMDSLLQEFSHPGIDARTNLNWDLMHFLTLKDFLPKVTDPKKRAMFEKVLGYFEEHVSPRIPEFTSGTIHGDINGLNIVVRQENAHYAMTGLIDFGDCVRSCYIFELGIMLGYAMLEKTNPIPLVGPMINGYIHAFPLPERELDCLYYLVLARLCQSGVLGDYQYTLEPWNTYLLTTPVHAWRVVEEMLATPKHKVDRIWTEARTKKIEDF